MPGKFVRAKDVEISVADFGTSRSLSNPLTTGARQLTVIDVTFAPGKGHNFHKHPDQEEAILVIAGNVEQWIDREKRLLGPGDSAFIPAGVVHATFNDADQPAKIVAILGPCVGPTGYEVVAKSPTKRRGGRCATPEPPSASPLTAAASTAWRHRLIDCMRATMRRQANNEEICFPFKC